VVGATRPEELRQIRKICGDMTFLLPGVGAQGADVKQMVGAGQGGGMLVSSSRAILYAGEGEDFAEKAREVALETRDEVNRHSN
jgi:orotidine-5'-phosphate decarboxylase